MLFYLLWTALPLIVLGQTYYINFVFNNNRYNNRSDQPSNEDVIRSTRISILDSETIEISSRESDMSWERSRQKSRETSKQKPRPHKSKKQFTDNAFATKSPHILSTMARPINTDEQYYYSTEWVETQKTKAKTKKKPTTPTKPMQTTKATQKLPSATPITTPTTTTTTATTTNQLTTKVGANNNQIVTPTIQLTTKYVVNKNQLTTQPSASSSPSSSSTTTEKSIFHRAPRPSSFFQYPEAVCKEDMNFHELFGIALDRDRGLPSKVLCDFKNSWGGPWLLMTRLELPNRVHMRHWFFGFITEDFKDINTNFLALAHIMNLMRIAMLIIGQDNNNQLVYNLYDDVVISGLNDLFMLRKAHLIEANTTDLLFAAVGEVLQSDTGRNRSCPFKVAGAWWGSKWLDDYSNFCIFPTDRDITRSGYMAIFIKPSPFQVNGTAFYNTAITTRRPWNALKAMNQMQVDEREKDFLANKDLVVDELRRRIMLAQNLEKRTKERIRVKTLT